VQIKSPFFEALTDEVNHRLIAALLAIAVLLVHFWIVILLLQPNDSDDEIKPPKIMEVVLIPELKPKAEPAQPAPKVIPPKKIPPKKKEVKPPVKQREQIIHKEGEILKPKTVTKESTPILAAPTAPVQKIDKPTAASQTSQATKAVAKPSNGGANSKGRDSGVVELGCPKPSYPGRARSRHIEGWVKIELSISPSGSVASARVVGAQPPGIFDEAALSATKNCRFKPKIVNGVAVTQTATKRSIFTLAN
jgi:protein TonB